MNVPLPGWWAAEMALRRRHFLQKRVNRILAMGDGADWGFETELYMMRAEIKWLNYLIREMTERGRKRR